MAGSVKSTRKGGSSSKGALGFRAERWRHQKTPTDPFPSFGVGVVGYCERELFVSRCIRGGGSRIIYTHMYVCMYVCMCIYIYRSIYLSIFPHMYVHMCIYIYTQYIYIYPLMQAVALRTLRGMGKAAGAGLLLHRSSARQERHW